MDIMDAKTSLVCDFAEMLVVPTGNYRMHVTKVCALQEIALDYGFLLLDDIENGKSFLNHKKTLKWMRHEIQQQMKLKCSDIHIVNEPQIPEAVSKWTIVGSWVIPF